MIPRALFLSLACMLVAAPLQADPADVPPEVQDEIVLLSAAASRASVAGRLRVHVEGPQGAPVAAFGAIPDRRLFSRLPAGERGGIGTALGRGPFSAADVWLAFSVLNTTEDAAWALVADGVGFRPTTMVVVAEDGSRAQFGGVALERLRHDAGFAGFAVYRLRLPANELSTVYLRLGAGAALGPDLQLWSTGAFIVYAGKLAGFSGIMTGLAVFACAVYVFQVALRGSGRGLPGSANGVATTLRYAYAILALCSIALGRWGGGGPAALFGACALAAEAVSSLGPWLGKGYRASTFYRHAAPRLVFAMALGALLGAERGAMALPPVPRLMSFVLPVGLLAQLALFVVIEAAAYIRKAKAGAEEADRLTTRLEAEIRGGADFMTATAAALRGPLYGLLGILENLDAVVADLPSMPKAAVSDLALARAEAARLDNLVSNILSYSGVGLSRVTVEDIDLASLARAAGGLLRVAVAGRGIHIEVEAPIIEMRSDLGLVHRLLYTAMNRAARADGAMHVQLTASSDDTSVRVLIAGDGIDPQQPAHGSAPVLDMDLTVLSRLAGLLGGSFIRERSGRRTILSFSMPRYIESTDPEREGTGQGMPLPVDPSMQPLLDESDFKAGGDKARSAGRVLVVGNEPVALLAIKRRLESSSWSVEVTVSAVDALSRTLSADPFDIVIIDSAMPEMSGFDFCESVRETRGPESVPIILLVEAGRADEIERAFRCGANDYIARPASGVELEARVRTHVDLASSVRRELEQAARMAEFDKYRTLALLSAGVAHEINTPNNAVLRNVPILKEIWSSLDVVVERLHREESGFSLRGFGYDDLKRDIPDMLGDLYMGAQDIKKIVEGLKDYAGAPSDASAPCPIDVNDSVRYAVRLLKHSITVSTERFALILPDGLPPVRADRLKLTQVVVNVLENALQALPDRSRGVRVETAAIEQPGGIVSVLVKVADEGTGMTPETLASVFHPFFTTKRDRGGSGLGLAVASGIVHDMAGSIDFSSIPGTGTEATIRIPAAIQAGRSDDGR